MREKGWKKSFALTMAAFFAFLSHRLLTIEFKSANGSISKSTPFVFIGNNKYEFSGFDLGERKRLDEGIFSVCVIQSVGKRKLLFLALKAMLGTVLKDKDFNLLGLHEVTISAPKDFISVAHDGEISKLRPPLHYEVLPSALSVIIPYAS
jgi:diacylglycerol kinase family enzyme